MTLEETTAPRRSVHSKVPLLSNAVCAAVRVTPAEFEPSGLAVNGPTDFVDNAPTQPLFEAIEAQRLSLLNVLDIVHCICVGVADGDEHPAPEVSAAFELLEREIQRIATALAKISPRSAMKARLRSRYPRLT